MKKVAIIGASGTLGRKLFKDFSECFEVVGTYFNNGQDNLHYLDIREETQTRDFIESENPDIVILTSAMTNVEACELNPTLARQINVCGVENVLNHYKNKLIYFSTDAIFDGVKRKYVEEDIPHPINVYGKTKLGAEVLVSSTPNHLIIRTSRLYGLDSNKFINKMISDLISGKEISVPKDTFGSLSFIEDVSRATLELVKRGRNGIYHVCGEPHSLDEVAYKISEAFELDTSLIRVVQKNHFNNLVSRANVVLSTYKLNKEGIIISSLEEGLRQIKKKL